MVCFHIGNDRFGVFVDDEFSIKEEAMMSVLKFGILVRTLHGVPTRGGDSRGMALRNSHIGY